jgi:glycerophosphoryl diester phosphodiesterase
MFDDASVSALLAVAQDAGERSLAARYAPIIRFDAREPFLPLAAGYTIFRASGASPSFSRGRAVDLAPASEAAASLAIEYAIWWDWDIGHLYELEHVWVFVDGAGRVVRGEASWHGGYHDMRLGGRLALDGDRLVVYSEPGKHAFAPTPQWFRDRRPGARRSETQDLAGISGLLMAKYIRSGVTPAPLKSRLAHTFLSQHAFEPSWDFSQVFRFGEEQMVPWPALHAWMPLRVNSVLAGLARDIQPQDFRVLRIGHRGAAAHAPHNTLLGLRTAAALGADAVEFDIQETADGQTVLSHDAYLIGAGGCPVLIGKSTLAELRAIDLGQGECIATLEQALALCAEEYLGAYIEVKDGASIPPLAAALGQKGRAEHCIVGSFRPDWLANLKALQPDVATSVLFGSPHLDAVKLAQSVGASYVHPCWERLPRPSALLTAEWVQRARAADLGIICWHEERPEEIAALRRAGVDGICSDRPELLR